MNNNIYNYFNYFNKPYLISILIISLTYNITYKYVYLKIKYYFLNYTLFHYNTIIIVQLIITNNITTIIQVR